ncbi:MAG TPA: glycosyltransferase family A protein, partial [Thermomicrobiales bacterium]|nr:glycosyltransferase family A protein [Thermomicrobiales bacterium]
LRRALDSLNAQTFPDWELVVVDDGSPDETPRLLAAYRWDPRVRLIRLPRNAGLGHALNVATAAARGRYLAYLPSDDLYAPDHLHRLVALLDARPEVSLAYGGLRWRYNRSGPTLRGEAPVGREAAALAEPSPARSPEEPLTSGNILALVQVMHRREREAELRWPERVEVESDSLEAEQWRRMLGMGLEFGYAGAVTCEWTDHPEQRHKLIATPDGGLSRFRAWYGIGRGEWLNWQPSWGPRLDERVRYGRFAIERRLPRPGGLRILLAGSLGFNPERIVAFEERGHHLSGLWSERPEHWDATGPFPFGNVVDVPSGRGWIDRVKEAKPDVIYALLNWQAVPLVREIVDADLGIPLVFHFKEGPFICQERGLWSSLVRILERSDGVAFISEENRTWFDLALDGSLDPAKTLLLDGDLPKLDRMGDDWAPKLSALDGEIHTVCTGRPLGLDPFAEIARHGIHVHVYGEHFHQYFPNWTREGLATGHLHLHPNVDPDAWVRELSRYDAAWFHLFDSANGGDLRRASWDDLNLPARIGTYAAAGLPWIMKDNRRSRVAVQDLAERHGIGVFFSEFEELAVNLRDRSRLREADANTRASRRLFAF